MTDCPNCYVTRIPDYEGGGWLEVHQPGCKNAEVPDGR